MKENIQDKDLGYREITKALKNINGSYVKVGLQGQTGQKTYGGKFDRVTVVDLGIIHEFGATINRNLKTVSLMQGLKAFYSGKIRTGQITIPERSFLRSTFDKMFNDWREMNKQLFWNIFSKFYSSSYTKGIDKALDVMGQTIQRDIKNMITRGIPPPNAASTLKAKMRKGRWNKKSLGVPKPLIDTGQMLNSITYEKVRK